MDTRRKKIKAHFVARAASLALALLVVMAVSGDVQGSPLPKSGIAGAGGVALASSRGTPPASTAQENTECLANLPPPLQPEPMCVEPCSSPAPAKDRIGGRSGSPWVPLWHGAFKELLHAYHRLERVLRTTG